MEEQLRPGALLVIAGSAGVGKTKLARELALRASARGWRLAGLTTGIRPAVPFGLVGELASQEEASFSAAGAAAGALRLVGTAPTLVVVDDAHRLDEAQATALWRRTRSGEVAVVATVSTVELGALPRPVWSLLHSSAALWLDLYPLPNHDLEKLLTAALGAPCDEETARQLLAVYNGNLPFLRELVISGYEDGRLRIERDLFRWRGTFAPAGALVAMIDARLGRLRADHRDALELLAQAQGLELRAVQQFMAAGDLAALERNGIITVVLSLERLAVDFASSLYRDRILAGTPPLRRALHQSRLAGLVAMLPRRREGDLARVVLHQLEARAEVGAGQLLQAAQDRWRAFYPQEALTLAAAAYDAAPGAETGALLGRILAALGRPREAEEILIVEEQRAADRASLRQLRLARASNLAFGLNRPKQAVQLLMEFTDTGADPTWAAERDGLCAAISYTDGSPGPAARIVERMAREGVDSAASEHSWALIFAASDQGHSEQALSQGELLQPLAARYRSQHPQLPTELDFGRWRAFDRLGRLDEAETFATACYSAAAAVGDGDVQRVWSVARGITALRRGLVRTSVQWLDEALDAGRPLPPLLNLECRRALAEARARVGERAPAFDAALLPDSGLARMAVLWGQGWQAVARGQLSQAREHFVGLARIAADNGSVLQELETLDSLVRLGAFRLVSKRALASAGRVDGEWAPLVVQRVRALRHGDAGSLAGLADQYAQLGMLLAAAETACFAAELHRRNHKLELAQRETVRAAGWHARCEGATGPAVAALTAGGEALTSREWQIAALAAAGLTSPAIADQLVVSVRTVESHLYNAYAKLGVHGRADLAAIFRTTA